MITPLPTLGNHWVDVAVLPGIDVKNVKLFFYMLGSMREAGVLTEWGGP